MELKLYERRTKTKILIDQNENQCYFCKSYDTLIQLEQFKPNVHSMTNERGDMMVEQRVRCIKCTAECVDVFCQIYPDELS